MIAASLVLQLVFVHANGRVALERKPGDASYVLFDKGREPALTPDGKRVYWWAGDGIRFADVDGGARGLFRAGNLRSPRVSPDGKQLIWGEMVGDRWAILRSPVDRAPLASPTILFRGDDSVFQPSWLPDGKGVIAHDLDHVYFIALDGKPTRVLPAKTFTDGTGGGTSSADRFVVCPTHANLIAYTVEFGTDGNQLWLYDLATQKRTRLTPADVFAVDPNWSRDGRFVYFRGFRKGAKPIRDGVLRIGVDGTGLVRVAPGGEPSL
jgi:Tol biopolymer transport system component